MSASAPKRNVLLRRLHSGFTIVETSLNRAEFRWKWLLFLQRSFALGVILCLLLSVFGAALLSGWITSKTVAVGLLIGLGVTMFAAWIVVVIAVAAGSPDRNWLASA